MIFDTQMSSRIISVIEKVEQSQNGFAKTFDREAAEALRSSNFKVLGSIDLVTQKHCWYVFSEEVAHGANPIETVEFKGAAKKCALGISCPIQAVRPSFLSIQH